MNTWTHPASMTPAQREQARYRPRGASAVRLKDGQSVVYVGVRPETGRHYAYAYRGKSINTKERYSFGTPEALAAFVQRFIDSVNSAAARRAQKQAERKAAGHDLHVGDVLYSSWGYDQTNIDYYEVTRCTEKSVWVREIGQQRDYSSDMSGTCVPVPGKFIGKETGPHRAIGERATCGYNGATRVAVLEVAGVKAYKSACWSSYA